MVSWKLEQYGNTCHSNFGTWVEGKYSSVCNKGNEHLTRSSTKENSSSSREVLKRTPVMGISLLNLKAIGYQVQKHYKNLAKVGFKPRLESSFAPLAWGVNLITNNYFLDALHNAL